jgi:sulfide dehydrogenase cytochrome subunit
LKLQHLFPCLILLTASAASHAAPPTVGGERLYASCASCHGTNGKAVGTTLPELAGQSQDKIIAAMRAFKAQTRDATVMHQIAKGYSDDQIARIAAFLAAQPATVKP